jgi:predicted N-acyltransferase
LKVEKINSNSTSYPALQKFISKHDLLFNSEEWLKNYPERGIIQCVILNNNNDVIGCFTYFQFKKSVFKFIISAPYSPDIDLFFVNPAESVVGKNSFNKDVLEAIANYFEALNVPYININLPAAIIDTQPFIWKGYTSKTRYSYLIDLSLSKEKLWENLSSEKRKSVNKAEKDGLVIKETHDPELIYSLVIKSLERNDVAKNKIIIKNILFEFASKRNSFAFVAYHNDKPIGVTFCLIDKTEAVYLFGGFDSDNKHHGAGVSCMWQSILKAKELGLKHFDFEGSMDPKIERYFREFGGELIAYLSVHKIKPVLKTFLALKKHNNPI